MDQAPDRSTIVADPGEAGIAMARLACGPGARIVFRTRPSSEDYTVSPEERAKRERDAYDRGVRAAVTWLHDRAAAMNDPTARAVLNSAASDLGLPRSRPRI